MIKTFIGLIFLTKISFAGLLDFVEIDNANTAYKNQQYSKSAKIYKNFDNDYARLNYGNSLYKQAKYMEALEQYQAIKNPILKFDSLHNAGNSEAKLKKFAKAIKNYESALSLKNDKNTKYNLDLVKKLQKQQRQQNKNKNSQDKKPNSQKNKQKSNKKDKKNQQKSKAEQRKKLDRLQQKKWEKSLRKPIQTLMIPLDKKGNNNENSINPW